ncbi:MAG: NAD(P)-dependent oxidoreductase [Finegoldia sp.]|nr:NAD(P)-dependent oxidoreductase [Finegoldia sp.]
MKVLISNRIPEETLKKYKENFDVDYNDSLDFLSKEELKSRLKGKDALVCPLSEKIDKEVIDAADSLKIIANFGAGYDNVDIAYAKEKGIFVTNAPAKSSAKSVAEYTMGLIVDIMRNITSMSKEVEEGKFEGWKPVYGLGESLEGKTLGIIGMGAIGQDLVRKALSFDMKVIFSNRSQKEVEGAGQVEKDELLKEADIVSLHTAYSDELHHMVDKESFDKMKDTAYLINTSRGKVVSEADLIEALKNKKIKGACLDVYEFEPEVSDELKNLDNVLLLPHLGNASYQARSEMAEYTFKNVMDVKEGRTPANKVN